MSKLVLDPPDGLGTIEVDDERLMNFAFELAEDAYYADKDGLWLTDNTSLHAFTLKRNGKLKEIPYGAPNHPQYYEESEVPF